MCSTGPRLTGGLHLVVGHYHCNPCMAISSVLIACRGAETAFIQAHCCSG